MRVLHQHAAGLFGGFSRGNGRNRWGCRRRHGLEERHVELNKFALALLLITSILLILAQHASRILSVSLLLNSFYLKEGVVFWIHFQLQVINVIFFRFYRATFVIPSLLIALIVDIWRFLDYVDWFAGRLLGSVQDVMVGDEDRGELLLDFYWWRVSRLPVHLWPTSILTTLSSLFVSAAPLVSRRQSLGILANVLAYYSARSFFVEGAEGAGGVVIVERRRTAVGSEIMTLILIASGYYLLVEINEGRVLGLTAVLFL